MENHKNINAYLSLRNELDGLIKKYELMHQLKMECKPGCDSCCESLKLFPVELDAIKNEVDINALPSLKLKHRFGKKCRFLVNHKCSIYNSRPLICRTQGLPLLYENSTGNAYELSVCKLNFKGVEVNDFNMDNALFMPPFNSRLFLLNQSYISEKYKEVDEFSRLKLNTYF